MELDEDQDLDQYQDDICSEYDTNTEEQYELLNNSSFNE